MRLRSIWDLTYPLPMHERLVRTADVAWAWAARRLPTRLRYEALIVSGVRAMRSHEVVPMVTYMTVLSRTPRTRAQARLARSDSDERPSEATPAGYAKASTDADRPMTTTGELT